MARAPKTGAGKKSGAAAGPVLPGTAPCAENATNGKAAKAKESEKRKFVFARENINSHLVSYNSDPKGYKIMGMLTYLFKEFKNEPADLLAKLKILTMSKKEKIQGGRVERMILEHLFLVLDLKDGFFANLFKFLKNDSFLAILASDLYFSAPFGDEDAFAEHFNEVYGELLAIWESRGAMSYASFDEEIGELAQAEDLERLGHECDTCEHEEDAMECEDAEEEKPTEDVVRNHREFEASDHSLVSLSDDERIAQLDQELGKIFHKNDISKEAGAYSVLLMSCVEKMVRNNYISDLQILNRLFYVYQFDQLSNCARLTIKALISKFSDRAAVFRMYQVAALVIQEVYALYSTFRAYCGEFFDELSLIKTSISFNQEGFVVNKIDSGVFYAFYTAGCDEGYHPFLLALVKKERNVDSLRMLLAHENTEEVETAIKAAIERKAARPQKDRKARNEAVQEREGRGDEAPSVGGPVETEDSSDEAEDVPARSRSFAEKIGPKIADKKKELKKKYRWENLKAKKKALRQARSQESDEERVKITKRGLREEENVSKKSPPGKTSKNTANKKPSRPRKNK